MHCYSPEKVLNNIYKSTIENHQGCWLWTKSVFTWGNYGQQKWKGKNWKVHRLIWTLLNGEIPEGLVVRHRCGNRLCCNPIHLEVGTYKENSEDTAIHGNSYFHNLEQDGSSNIMAKLTEDQVYEMRNLYKTGEYSLDTLGKMFNVERKCAERTCRGVAYSCYTKVPGFDWRDSDLIRFNGRFTNKGLELIKFYLDEGLTRKQIMDNFGIESGAMTQLIRKINKNEND